MHLFIKSKKRFGEMKLKLFFFSPIKINDKQHNKKNKVQRL